jgi:cell division GTPase FtsZ
VNVVTSTTRRALLTGTAVEADTADAALVVVAGRSAALPRKGVERARRWVEEETGSMQVRGGDFPVDSGRIASLVLLSGIERTARVQSFVERAREAASGSGPDDGDTDAAAANGSASTEAAAEQWAVDELDDLT